MKTDNQWVFITKISRATMKVPLYSLQPMRFWEMQCFKMIMGSKLLWNKLRHRSRIEIIFLYKYGAPNAYLI
uniref:Uncharacterized protein n=1 Tax=Arundo donax TaxID=35708 RepID=A0A0A9FRG2_ARUDO